MNDELCDLRLGDSREVLRGLPDNSVDSAVTDPPYALDSIVKRFGGDNAAPAKDRDGAFARASAGFMGQKWDTGECAFDPDYWREVYRVLKPGGFLLAFSGTRTQHRMVVAIEDAGFEIRDQIGWLYGSGMPKSHNQGDGRGTALKPAWEPICVARKPLIGTVAANLAEHGTGALNIDACRIPTDEPIVTFDRIEGERSREQYRWGTGDNRRAVETAGRWPANICHDGSDEVLAAFAAFGERRAGSEVKGTEPSMTGSESTVCYNKFNRVPSAAHGDSGTAARFFFCGKASKRDREEGCEDLPDAVLAMGNGAQTKAAAGDVVDEGAGAFGVARVRKNNHPTVKPTELMRWLCRLVTPPGGVVLDPFMGSGSTGKAAMLEGFRFIGIEREEPYLEIARARVAFGLKTRLDEEAARVETSRQGSLFGDAA